MISMTGFACREKAGADTGVDNGSISLPLSFSSMVEIRGVNSRFLEININAPPWLSAYESAIRECIGKSCRRGKIDVYIRVTENNVPVTVKVNTEAARAYKKAISDLASDLNIREKIPLSVLLNMDGVIQVEKNRDSLQYWQEIESVFKEALQLFIQEREREGECTKNDILKQLSRLENSLNVVSSFASKIEENIKKNLRERFAELLGDKIDENRILTETASWLVKCTVSEEIARLTEHLSEFKAEIERNPQPGKKLDFLSQEINREVNTIGSKSTIIEVSNQVVEMKDALENIREQLRNVE